MREGQRLHRVGSAVVDLYLSVILQNRSPGKDDIVTIAVCFIVILGLRDEDRPGRLPYHLVRILQIEQNQSRAVSLLPISLPPPARTVLVYVNAMGDAVREFRRSIRDEDESDNKKEE